jgi:pimeloyl-ACP methyl ester carboxylesterase
MAPRVVLFPGEDPSGIESLKASLSPWFELGEPAAEPCAAVGIGAGAVDALDLAARGAAAVLILLHPVAEPVGGIDVPTLILWGEDDPERTSDSAEAIHELIDLSSLGLLPGCGPNLLVDAPQTVIPMVVEYLRSQYLGVPHGHGAVPISIGRRDDDRR